MGMPIGTPGREPLSPAAREMDEDTREAVLELQAEHGARNEAFAREYARNHPGFFRRLFRRRPSAG